jgi:hypothetical protein
MVAVTHVELSLSRLHWTSGSRVVEMQLRSGGGSLVKRLLSNNVVYPTQALVDVG